MSRPGTSNSNENRSYVYRSFAFCRFSATVLVILSMLMNGAGCYNAREKKLVVRQLTSTVNSYGIATFSVRGEGLRFFDFLKCMNTILRGFSVTITVL